MSTSSESKYNWLISLVCPNGNHDPINLPHQEALFLGRSPETRIFDPKCSIKQVKLLGDLITGEIQVTQTASNSSALDRIMMIKDKVYNMKHSSTLHIIAGIYSNKLQVKCLGSNAVKQSPKTKHKDPEYLKTVAEKLDMLKSRGKLMRIPSKDKPSTSKSGVGSAASETKTLPQTNTGPASTSRWDHNYSLHVYTSKGLEGRSKVKRLRSNAVKQSPETKHKHSTSGSNWALDKKKKALPKDKIKSSSNRNTNYCKYKRVRLSRSERDKKKSESDKKYKSKKENHENVPEENSSKLKENGLALKSEKKTERISSVDEDPECLKTVAENLDILKSRGTLMRTPSNKKPSTSKSSVGSAASDTKTLPQTNTGLASTSSWDHDGFLYVYTSNELEGRSKVSNAVKQSPETKHKHSSSGSNGALDKEKKALPKDKIKPSSKRKSSFEDTNDFESKGPRLSESEIDKRKSESDKKHNSNSKKENHEDVPKLKNGSASESEKKTERISSVDKYPDYPKTVAEKLDKLKSQGKLMRTPTKEKPSTSKSSAGSAASETKTLPQTNTGHSSTSRWDQYDSLYVYTSKGLEGRSKIAAFDIDGTIIETQSGKVFPVHLGDWRMKFNNSKKIRKYYEDGFKIVFFTNQMGVSRGKTNMSDLKTMFTDVLEEINIPIQIFVSTKGGLYRKPSTGMWDFLVEKGNGGVPVELSQSFFVGDAAGRPVNWAPKKKKDFSCSDRLFALNIGIDFHSPEEFFIGYPSSTFQLPQFDPRKVSSKTPLLDPADARLTSKETEVIILVGCPASGKSHFSKKYFVPKGYAHVDRKWVTECKDNLEKGTSVIIDTTNPDVKSRARYLKVASSLNVPCRCFVFNATLDQAKHNERFREITEDKSHQPIHDIIMSSFKRKFNPPVLSEGFTEIVKVNFVPIFRDEQEEKLYRKFLMEK